MTSTTVTLAIEGDEVVVHSEFLRMNRRANLFFRGVMGSVSESEGWRSPRRRETMRAHFLRIYDWLERAGYQPIVEGQASELLERELQRRRSFERTRDAARELREGRRTFDFAAAYGLLRKFGWRDQRELRVHQIDGVAHALTAGSAANFSVPGSGKTLVALATAALHMQEGIVNLLVVVGPLSSFHPWETEARAAVGDELRLVRIRGPRDSRLVDYSRTEVRDLLLMSYATAATDQLELLGLFERFKVMLVVDESHRVKRFRGGVWAPALMELARRAKVRMILSGTPMPQSARDLYSQLNILWPDGQLTGGRLQFAELADNHFSTLVNRIEPFTSRTSKEALGLPPYEVQTHDVALPPVQETIYQLVVDRIRVSVEQAHTWQDKIAALRRAQPIRLLQAASNPDLLNRRDEEYHTEAIQKSRLTILEQLAAYPSLENPGKSEFALQLVFEASEAGKKVVVWSNFLRNLDHFASLVRGRLQIPVFQIDGRVPAGEDALRAVDEDLDLDVGTQTRELVIERFLSSGGPGVLVANPAACSESISLHQACRDAIYLDRTYDAALWLQSLDRIHRLGLKLTDTVTVHVLRASSAGQRTIDHLVDASLHSKQDRMESLLEGAKLAPLGLALDPSEDAEGDQSDLGHLLRYLQGELS